MEKINYFLDKVNNLDELTKDRIKKIISPKFGVQVDRDKNMGEEINKLLKDIERKIPKTFGSSIHYILGEFTDNIEQHSNYSNAYIFFKQNAKKDIIEILIFDDGLTIPFVFETNNIRFSKDSEAIKLALKGMTTKKETIPRGFGLRTSKEIVKALKGSMKIISRKGFLDVKNSTIYSYDVKKELKGTLILLKLKIPEKDLNIYNYLE